MSTVTIRGHQIVSGSADRWVAVTGATREEILTQAKAAAGTGAGMVWWRADCYQDVDYDDCVRDCLSEIRAAIGDIPLVFTFRTLSSGGARTITQLKYIDLIILAASTGDADLIDVDMARGDIDCRYIIEELHAYNTLVMGAGTDGLHKTSPEDFVQMIRRMDKLGADMFTVEKLPENFDEVKAQLPDKPLILAPAHEPCGKGTDAHAVV